MLLLLLLLWGVQWSVCCPCPCLNTLPSSHSLYIGVNYPVITTELLKQSLSIWIILIQFLKIIVTFQSSRMGFFHQEWSPCFCNSLTVPALSVTPITIHLLQVFGSIFFSAVLKQLFVLREILHFSLHLA